MKSLRTTLFLFAGYLVIAAATYHAYRNHFLNPFVFDDSHAVVENVHIRSISNIPKFFRDPTLSSTLPANQGYRPIITASLALDYWLGSGLHPYHFHRSMFIVFLLQNLLFCHLLFVLFRRIVPGEEQLALPGALLSTAIYSLHPANAETLNYIIARSDSYSTFLVVLALWLSLVPKARVFRFLGLAAAFLGVLAKEPAATFPALLFLAVLFFETPFTTRKFFSKEVRQDIFDAARRALPAAAATVCAVILYFKMVINALPSSTTRLQYLATQAWVVSHYVLTFLLPVHLNADSDLGAFDNVLDDRALAGCLILGCLFVAGIYTARAKRLQPITFGIFWFFITLAPTSSIFPIEDVTNDHRMFFPFIGLAMAAGWAVTIFVAEILENFSMRWARGIAVACIGVVYFLSDVRAVEQRCAIWRSNESLWYDVTLKSPNNGRGLMNYGLSQMAKGNYERAENYFLRAQKVWPRYPVLQVNLGVLYGAMDRKKEAEQAFHRAITLSNRSPTPGFYYARWLNEEGRFAEAKVQLKQSLQENPTYLEALQMLLSVSTEGLEDRETLDQTVTKLASLYPADSELVRYKKILSGELPFKTVNQLIDEGMVAYNTQDYARCIELPNQVLAQSPWNSLALNNLGAAQLRLGHPEEAISALERSLKMAPTFELARNNLTEARKMQEQKTEEQERAALSVPAETVAPAQPQGGRPEGKNP